eukprot:TRINITY_DN40881_c0_g1_i1.p1 TRINITY_DN40881_c0_g1~~TRINITY_DN40881_c0_g1_i1.p1  ORF type:complete len:401 (+),score=43.06 TRINITY_DN40881_c0_g1_i1:174-1376(+)
MLRTGESDAEKNSAYDNYQAYLGNLMMLGALIFGFCAAGTFLSVTFTGDEPPMRDQLDLQGFLQSGLWAGLLALFALVIAFVVSSRLSYQYSAFGSARAFTLLAPAHLVAGAAELLLYLGLFLFLFSLHFYSRMNYVGPPICPEGPLEYSFLVASQLAPQTASFCSLLGEDFFEAASDYCGDNQTVLIDNNSSTCGSARAGPHAVLCGAFDCYSHLSEESDGGFWFGWLHKPHGWEEGLTLPEHPTDKYFSAGQLWDTLVAEAGEMMCQRQRAHAVMVSVCKQMAEDSDSLLACAEARATYLEADYCARGKYHEADKCRKVCLTKGETLQTLLWKRSGYGALLAYGLALVALVGRGFSIFSGGIMICRKKNYVKRPHRQILMEGLRVAFVEDSGDRDIEH